MFGDWMVSLDDKRKLRVITLYSAASFLNSVTREDQTLDMRISITNT